MLLRAFDDAKYLEDVTGLAQLQADTETMMEGMELFSDDDSTNASSEVEGSLASDDDD